MRSTLLVLALGVAVAGAALAHGGSGSGYGEDAGHHGPWPGHYGMMGSGAMGPGMMGEGMMQPGMMGHGMMGPGMMGPGMMGQGMMGQGMMGAFAAGLAGLPQAERDRLRELHAEHAAERFDQMLAMAEARRDLQAALSADTLDEDAVAEAYDRLSAARRDMMLSGLRFRSAVRDALPEDFQAQLRERMQQGSGGMMPGQGAGGHGMGQGGMMHRGN
ncbi:periplasmic heavy metal sensor [Sediminicurvatus halobius]|uniref:Zinc resistance-associated protein n=1 Tax=Sediminicurvatus halobius TaxID=2182432 RepID=A0A2U2MXR1_9GAMM|nr:periplasmic heavy metal sensor [Spiribacter halobius]PWG61562.1 hypothetical protein DEM34_15775 [Spiribacter halobius]UEX77130.1 periplasmic heavy metal sensor [Spiribacter halobius]